ncbi:flexible cuticle protein 12-like [Schistocerca piceifrons]|uniref:flexible cuticle protein 12-like n=1 Tax=Schistocerca piceifrons TaxID=274613 RepID=UPI001F5F9D2A|nr:flexible cuticle protein 12-like [Schistocerca piceifrons]
MGPSAFILGVLMLKAVSVASKPQIKPEEVVILEQENNFNGVDPWRWSYKTSDGQSHEESGALTPDGESVALQGGYTWTSPEGITFTVTYTADDDRGFVPTVTQQGAGGVPKPLEPQFGGGRVQPQPRPSGYPRPPGAGAGGSPRRPGAGK